MTQNGATPEQLNALSKPVPNYYIKTDDKGNSYVTARFIMNLLDSTVEKANWKDSYRLVVIGGKEIVECTLSIKVNGEWVGKADVGGPAKTFSPEKSLYSGALKRAAFRWGIARELYGEGNYYVPPNAPADTSEDGGLAAAFDDMRGTAPQPGAPAPRDVEREMGVDEDDDGTMYDWSADDRPFTSEICAELKLAMVDADVADHPNHAAAIILQAMNEAQGVDGWGAIYKAFTVNAVYRAVAANRAAKAAEGEG